MNKYIFTFLLAFSANGTSAGDVTCVFPTPGKGWVENGCYIYVRPGMIIGSNKRLNRGGFFLREDADGAWRQVPMFYSEGVEAENNSALNEQDLTYGSRY